MIFENVDELLQVLERAASAHDGEDVDLLAHMLQCGALLIEQASDDLELQAAGLVHDVGTVLEPDRPATHAATGALAVESLLGLRVAALVAGHDQAKRYLVSAVPDYRAELSETSVLTLGDQGGDMTPDEQANFEAGELFDALVVLRRADDAAKVRGRSVPDLHSWRATLEALAARRT